MRYERPMIVHRERLAALLDTVQSNVQPDGQPDGVSDFRVKDNVRPVTWGDEAIAYAPPAIAERETLEALLGANQSNVKPPPDAIAPSDVHVKEHIVPVRW